MKFNSFKRVFLALTLSVAGFSTACAQAYLNESLPIEQRVEDALSRMTLEEKVALCHAQSKFTSAGVPRLGIPEIHMSDGPHGVRQEINWGNWGYANWENDSCTAFPTLTCLAATWEPEMSSLYGINVGEEARYRGKDILLGPGVNIYRTPLNGRNFEYMGEDPLLASRMVVPYIKGLQSNGVAACVKHYALNNQELWRGNVDVRVSDRALREIYLPAFKAAAEEGGAWSFMGSYNKYNGQHLCENKVLLNDVLKKEWNWDGVVVTDWGGCHSTEAAALNGLDIEMGTGTDGLSTEGLTEWSRYYFANPYIKALRSGKISEDVVNGQARRILRLIFRTAMNSKRPFGRFACEEHDAVCRQIANEGIVLLKNKATKSSAAMLPLKAEGKKILVVGENANKKLTAGGGSSELKVKHEVSVLDAMRETYGDNVMYAKGFMSGGSYFGHIDVIPQASQDSLRNEAVEMARNADIIVYVGGLNKNSYEDMESTDRKSMQMSFCQNELINALLAVQPHMVVVLNGGNAVEIPMVDKIPSIVMAWYGGSEVGHSVVDILSGKVNPSGKLPFSFYKNLKDCGANAFGEETYPGTKEGHVETYTEGIYVGYRWLDRKKIAPLYPFGHGLSYTTFQYGKTEIADNGEDITVSVEVKNTGNVAGKEVVQLYVSAPGKDMDKPVKELKAFKKTAAVNPGESYTATMTFKKKDLASWSEKTNDWVLEKGKYTILVGASSRDIRKTISFNL